MEHAPLLVLAGVGAAGIVAQWVAWRLRLPSILVLLVAGAAAGTTGLLDPDELLGDLLFPVVSLSVALILFEGSLSLGRRELRDAGRPALLLCTVGAGVTFAVLWGVGAAGLDIDPGIAALIAANLIVTGPTVIGPLLQQVRPRGRVGAILRAEGIIIDPIGAAAAIVVFEVISAEGGHTGVIEILATLGTIAASGTVIAAVGGALLLVALERFWLPDHLRQPAVVATVLLTFALSDHLQEESGLVGVTVLGLLMANQHRVELDQVLEFAENLQVLVLSSLFLLLAARLDLDVVRADLPGNLLLLAVAVIVARPAAVALSTIGSGLTLRERLFLSAVAPRGIVAAAIASVFAIRLDEAGMAGSERFAGAVLTVLIGSILVYGIGARWVGQRLEVAETARSGVLIVGAHGWGTRLAELLREHGLRTLLIDRDRAKVVTARYAGQDTVHGSVLSARVRDELDLEGIGHLLALTKSHELNALAAERFRSHFGRQNTWQLPSELERADGRTLQWPDLETIERRLSAGARLKATRLSDRFTWDDYRVRNTGTALFAVVRTGGLLLPTVGADPLVPIAGDVVIVLVNESPREGPDDARSAAAPPLQDVP